MKKRNLITLSLGIAASFCCYAAAAQDKNVAKFGTTEGTPVSKGVVFVDGQYIQSPYVISRRGLALYVNDHEVQRPRRHIETPVLTGDVDPSTLSEPDQQKLFRALEATRNTYEEYLRQGHGYLFSSKGGHIRLPPSAIGYQLPRIVELLASDAPRDLKRQQLQDRNWHLHIDVEPFVSNFQLSPQLTSRMAQQAEESLKTDIFGVDESLTTSKGFIFLHGRYVEPPYVFQRKGLGLFLNGKVFIAPEDSSDEMPRGGADVLVPAEINAESSWFDDAVVQYLSHKKAFLLKRYPPEQATDMIVQVIAALPLVTGTRRDDKRPDVLHVTTTEGLTIPHWLGVLSPRILQDRNSVLRSVRARTDHFHSILARGSCLFMSDGGWTFLSPITLDRTLPRIVGLLRSGQTKAAQSDAIKGLGLGMPDKTITELVTGFSVSPALEARIAAMGPGADQMQ